MNTQDYATEMAPGGVLVSALGGIRSFSVIVVLCGLSLAMSFLVFPRMGWSWLAYVCLVPWLLAVGYASKARHAYVGSYLFGAGYFALNVHWLMPITMAGYVTLCLFFGLVAPMAALGIRQAKRRGVPLALAAPIAWVALEYLRSIGGLAFPLVLLGHSQYRQLTVIQIADLVGAYGVSFMLAMVNGLIVDLMALPIIMDRREGRPKLSIGVLATAIVVSLTLIYGSAQKSESYLTDGPTVAVMQHDILKQVPAVERREFGQNELFQAQLQLTRQAVALTPKPALVLTPEAMVPFVYPNRDFLEYDDADLELIYRDRWAFLEAANPIDLMKRMRAQGAARLSGFTDLATTSGVPIVFGAGGFKVDHGYDPPRVGAFNSAYLLEPGETVPTAMYSKRHLVLFGEYIPFRYSIPSVYALLNGVTPFADYGAHYSQSAGVGAPIFETPSADSSTPPMRVGTPICYEELMPYIGRDFVRPRDGSDEKAVDVLLCLSNDGWFFHASELEQHLAGGVFRAVENRVALARSVNTGASAIIDPNGHIRTRVAADAKRLGKLDEVESALRALRVPAGKLTNIDAKSAQFQDVQAALKKTAKEQLRRAWRYVGPEFEIYSNRLERLQRQVNPRNPLWKVTAEWLVLQIDDDLGMVQRWRDLPWQMPGVAASAIKLDNRVTLYTVWGDWFVQGLVVLLALSYLDRIGLRLRRRRLRGPAKESSK